MHDPWTVAFEIKYPWHAYSRARRRASHHNSHERTYRESFITIWHVDPDLRGDDDSCGRFMRLRHGNKEMFERIVKRFEFDWDRVYVSEESKTTYHRGYFSPDGTPVMSTIGIVVNLFYMAALEYFNHDWNRANKFMQRHLFSIIFFAENPVDSLADGIQRTFGGREDRTERIRSMAGCVYTWILRKERPWWRNPRWHIWHWSIRCHPWSKLRRLLLTRCCKCGKGFRYNESPTTGCWDAPKLRFLRGETHLYHSDCNNRSSDGGPAEAVSAS